MVRSQGFGLLIPQNLDKKAQAWREVAVDVEFGPIGYKLTELISSVRFRECQFNIPYIYTYTIFSLFQVKCHDNIPKKN